LRQAASEAERLRALNQQLKAQPHDTPSSPRAGSSAPQTVQAYWPKNQLAFAGSSEPVAALKSALWAMSQGQTQALESIMSPAALERVMADEPNPRGELVKSASSIASSLAPVTGFSITGQRLASPDRAIFDLYFEGEGKTRKVALKKIGDTWKLEALGLAGGNEEAFDYGGQGWP
jgi:hypothetical protein